MATTIPKSAFFGGTPGAGELAESDTFPADQEIGPQETAPGNVVSKSLFFGEPNASGAGGGKGLGASDLPPEAFGDGSENVFEGIVRDTIEGSVAPLLAAWHAGRAVLSDPIVGMLPAEEEQEAMDEAGRQAIKGAAFWGSTLVGGRVLGMAIKPLYKAALAGGTSAVTFEALRKLPDLGDHTVDPNQYVRDVATAGAFGALTGGVLSKSPAATRATIKAANQVIDKIPGGAKLRDGLVGYAKEAHAALWDKFFTSGQEVLRKAGLKDLANQLIKARDVATITGLRLVGGFRRNIQGLNEEELQLMGSILDSVNFRSPAGAAEKVAVMGKFWAGKSPERFNVVWNAAKNESRRLRLIGLAMQKAGVKVYDPESDQFHSFVLRNEYLPHRFVDGDLFRVGGSQREGAIKKLVERRAYTEEDAKAWVDAFADRIDSENADFLEKKTVSIGASHMTQGRELELPGFETDVSKILPQYYEHVAKRIANASLFGRLEPTEPAVRQAVMFGREEWKSLARSKEEIGQLEIPGLITTGKGMKKGPPPPRPQPTTTEELMAARRMNLEKESRRSLAIERKYERAFAPIEALPEGTLKDLSRAIVRRQLGAIEKVPYGEGVLKKAAMGEVVTKLALGAISQPSQVLSGVVRTFYRGSVPNFLRAMSGDPDMLDFALRSGAPVLSGIVRASEQSLTGGETDFLKRVFFTQLDMKSRIFGALQGRAYAEHMANKLTMMSHKFPLESRTPKIAKEMAKIERKLGELGLPTAEIVSRGGWLKPREMMQAGMRVSGDVNFWGDALSLPEFYKSPYGKFMTQFKSFGFQQSRMIKEHVVKPMLRGDWGPITRLAVTMPLGGEMIADLKALVRAKDPGERKGGLTPERIAENIGNAAGFGLMSDAFEATRYGVSGSLGLAVGPVMTDAAKLHVALGDALRGDPEKLGRVGIELGLPLGAAVVAPGAAPYVAAAAPALSNVLLPKRETPK